jgi:hypothetical protein
VEDGAMCVSEERVRGMAIASSDLLSPITTLVSAVVGFAGVIFTLWVTKRNIILTLDATRRNQERKQAFDAYDEYLKDCFEQPMFANGQLASDPVKIPCRYREGDHKFYQYEWFVARLMLAAERILKVSPGDVGWENTIKSQIRKHANYVDSRYFQSDMYSIPLQRIIAEVRREDKQSSKAPPPA